MLGHIGDLEAVTVEQSTSQSLGRLSVDRFRWLMVALAEELGVVAAVDEDAVEVDDATGLVCVGR